MSDIYETTYRKDRSLFEILKRVLRLVLLALEIVKRILELW